MCKVIKIRQEDSFIKLLAEIEAVGAFAQIWGVHGNGIDHCLINGGNHDGIEITTLCLCQISSERIVSKEFLFINIWYAHVLELARIGQLSFQDG